MNDRVFVSENITYIKDKSMAMTEFPRLVNTFRVKKYRENEAEPFEIVETHNAVTSAGKDLFLRLGVGASSDHLNHNTDLRIYNTSSALVKTISSTSDNTYPHDSDHPSVSVKNLVYRWTDSSTDTYNANRLDVVSPASAVFSQATMAFGNKAANEQWIYEYTVSISSADSDFTDAGLDTWLRAMKGDTSNHWDSSLTRCGIYSGPTLITAVSPSSGPTVNVSTDTVSWVFTFGNGAGNGDWSSHNMRIFADTFSDLGNVILRSGNTGTTGVKGSGDTWTVTYQFSIN